MTADEVFRELQITGVQQDLAIEWDRSGKSFTSTPGFLEPEFIREAVTRFLHNGAIADVLIVAADAIKKNPAALRFIWHQHYLAAQNYERHFRKCYQFPELPVLGAQARPYYLLLALSGYFLHGDIFEALGIPEEMLTDVIKDFKISVDGSVEKTGRVGVAPHYSGWWQGLFNGRLIRLGRLTFLQEKYEWSARIFQHRESGALKILSDLGIDYTPEGLTCFQTDKQEYWTSELVEDETTIKGNVISANGYAQKSPQTLEKADWQEIVEPGDNVIGIHISAGEPLDTQECEKSFERAIEFYQRFFPGKTFKLFVCETWFLDPQLQKFCNPESNIVKFQKLLHLLPSTRDFEFVSIRSIFGAEALKVGFENVPHKSSLQKGAAQFKSAGGVLRQGFGCRLFRP